MEKREQVGRAQGELAAVSCRGGNPEMSVSKTGENVVMDFDFDMV